MEELKPCPFCGSKPILEHKILKPFYDFWYVKCDVCSATISNPSMEEKEAIEAWNRRLINLIGESIISSKEGGEMMKVYITHTNTKCNEGEIRECESLESCCESLLDTEDFNGFAPELVISKPDMDSPLNEKSKSCKWCIEIYDDYRE